MSPLWVSGTETAGRGPLRASDATSSLRVGRRICCYRSNTSSSPSFLGADGTRGWGLCACFPKGIRGSFCLFCVRRGACLPGKTVQTLFDAALVSEPLGLGPQECLASAAAAAVLRRIPFPSEGQHEEPLWHVASASLLATPVCSWCPPLPLQ